MKIISVIPLKKGVLKGELTYFTSHDIPPGDIVSIPLRGKNTLGLVVSTLDLEKEKSNVKGMDFNLRKVNESKGASIFRVQFLDAVFDTAKYFAQNRPNVIATLIPNIFIEEYDKLAKLSPQVAADSKEKISNVLSEKLIFQAPLAERISSYKTLIRESFARGKSVFIVVPTELDIELFAESLKKGIEQFTFTFSGKTTPKKNLSSYEKAVSVDHPVLIVATPPFLSIPRQDITTVILEHESAQAYRMIARPHLDMRVFVEIFASKIGARFILADNMLRFETIERRELDGVHDLYPPTFRIGFNGEIEILGPRNKEEKFQVLKEPALEDIKHAVRNKKNVFIFTLRKGLATQTLCRDCGHTVSCVTCGSSLILYTSQSGEKRMFVCNKCSEEKDPNTACENCGSWNLVPLGIGTDTVYEFLKDALEDDPELKKTKILKLDKESAKTKTGAQKIVSEFEDSRGAILIGTEMAILYLNDKVPLSVIASFDSLWSIPNFRMGEKILRIMLAIIEKTENKFIIQAKNVSDGAVAAIRQENVLSFVREELADRKTLGYPPFVRFIKVTYHGDKKEVPQVKEFLEEMFKEYTPQIFSGLKEREKNLYATNALIKMDPKNWNLPSLSLGGGIDENLHQKISSLPPQFQVFIDPEDLL